MVAEVNYVELTDKEHFALNFITSHNGKSIPTPLPEAVRSLIRMGLVRTGCTTSQGKKCYLTDAAAKFHKPTQGGY